MTKEIVKLLEEFKHEWKQEIKYFRECMEKELRKNLRVANHSMSFMNEKFEEMKKAFQTAISKNVKLKQADTALKQVCDDLWSKLKEREARITQCEHYSRRRNLEVEGVPTHPNDNVSELVKKIGNLVHEEIRRDDIEVCNCVPVLSNYVLANIVVQFTHAVKRNKV